MSSNKTIRLSTTPGKSQNIQVKVEQEFDTLDILSLKITQEDAYRNFCSDYGVVVGRVIANDGFGVENAKVSIFIPLSGEDVDNPSITAIYPYTTPNDLNSEGIRYNLLPKNGRNFYVYEKIPATLLPATYWNNPNTTPHGNFVVGSSWVIVLIPGVPSNILPDGTKIWKRLVKGNHGPNVPVGTMPSKTEILDNDIQLEIYDKYFKLSTRTNSSGDYMIFGVPTGNQTVHMDVDISDAGQASVNVQDLLNSGFPVNLFNGNDFKSSSNLDALPQIETRNIGVEVVPFWGNLDQCEIGVTRLDFNLNKIITPSATLIFQAFTTTQGRLNKNCNIASDSYPDLGGNYGSIKHMTKLPVKVKSISSNGTKIETFDGGNVFMTVPMFSERKVTNEFGQLVPSPDGIKGVATSGNYGFAIWGRDTHNTGFEDSAGNSTARYITPSVVMRYDMDNKKKLIYTLGNRNHSAQAYQTNDLRKFSIETYPGNGIDEYPSSVYIGTPGKKYFNGNNTCYGSLYFPKFENDNGFCTDMLQYDDWGNTSEEYAGFVYNTQSGGNRLSVSGFMDVTDILKEFQTFGGPLSQSSARAGNSITVPTIPGSSACLNCQPGQINIGFYTAPFKNTTTGGSALPPLGSNRLDSIGDSSVVNIVNGSSLTPTQSVAGRYYYYFGLYANDNALTHANELLDV